MAIIRATVNGISRHRILSDGKGVTTLVALKGCTLTCKYCLNPQNLHRLESTKDITPKELLDVVLIDDLYFRATGGGVCFGGGEPLLYSDFIREFKLISPSYWKITIETSLNVEINLRNIAPLVDLFIVDCKDINSRIYKSYTGKDNSKVISNLQELSRMGITDKVLIRVPLIYGYNREGDQHSSVSILKKWGFKQFDLFEYIVPTLL
ncbi:MAG: radical SAM protein [Paludibacteraceae bacterium]|nr:radical SAM protein [Paludibacteraceae bacterium]